MICALGVVDVALRKRVSKMNHVISGISPRFYVHADGSKIYIGLHRRRQIYTHQFLENVTPFVIIMSLLIGDVKIYNALFPCHVLRPSFGTVR